MSMKIEVSTDGVKRSAKRDLGNGEAHNGVKLKGKRRTRRRIQAYSLNSIQRLFMACKKVFKGPGTVPEPAEVEMLQQLLDKLKPEDLGLSTDLFFFNAKNSSKTTTPRITYTTIYKSNNFSMVLFFLPPRGVIPLHNHPGMTVFSKLLLGSMHIKSYDWTDPVNPDTSTQPNQLRLVRKVVDSEFTAPCEASILYPTTGGNMHRFTAVTPCAVLDVLGPPYSKEEDRDCTYYQDYPYSYHPKGGSELTAENADELGWLEEIEMPKDLKMDGIEYLGPPIIE